MCPNLGLENNHYHLPYLKTLKLQNLGNVTNIHRGICDPAGISDKVGQAPKPVLHPLSTEPASSKGRNKGHSDLQE